MDHNLPGLFAQRGRYVLVLAIDVHRLLFSLHIIAKGYTLLHVSLYYKILLYGCLDLNVLYHLCLIVYPIGSYFLQVKWKTWSGSLVSVQGILTLHTVEMPYPFILPPSSARCPFISVICFLLWHQRWVWYVTVRLRPSHEPTADGGVALSPTRAHGQV